MGERTEIRWTDHTFNPWWGCARVSEACQHCYAEAWAKRTGHDVWGKGADRRFFGENHWNEPLRWNRKAEAAGKPALVFCASMADVFEDHPALPPEREKLWDLIEETPWLTWQLLTKRPENIIDMIRFEWVIEERGWPQNVWVGTTVENQRWANERLDHLVAVPAPVRFVSAEPLFGEVDLLPWIADVNGVNWVIAGGESGPKARPSHPDWFRNLRDTCAATGVPFMFKQWGEWGPVTQHPDAPLGVVDRAMSFGDPYDAEVTMVPVGKKAAGWTLDGRTHDEIPGQPVPV